MAEKLQNAAPYNLFFNKVHEEINALDQEKSITFTDLLCPSLGELKCSLQLTFLIDAMWLMEQYEAQNVSQKPLTILYGKMLHNSTFPEQSNITHGEVKMKDRFGTHHSKVGLYVYTDGSLRIVISTANLIGEDWTKYNQGIWVSPACPRLPENFSDNDGDGPTGFKTSFLHYLQSYELQCLNDWVGYVKRADFSAIRVFLVASIPGHHYGNDGCHIHRVTDLLTRNCSLPQSEEPLPWGIHAQCSSIGTLGKIAEDWLMGDLFRTLSSYRDGHLDSNEGATINVIYPCEDNVMKSHFGAEGGDCLSYQETVHEKQEWLKDYLYQWKADELHRSQAMPHIKTYYRISPCLKKLAWFLLTSANISKAAWGGKKRKKDSHVYVRSYEVGVMFLPSFFDEDYFNIKKPSIGEHRRVFPFLNDLPLTRYSPINKPWCTNKTF